MQYIQGQKGCHAIHPGLKGMPCNTSRAQWECHAIHQKGSVGMTCNTAKGLCSLLKDDELGCSAMIKQLVNELGSSCKDISFPQQGQAP